MLSPTDFLTIAILGCAGGFISGLLGVGGGIVFIPILQFYLERSGVQDPELVNFILANSLFVIIFSGLVISRKQYRMGNLHPKPIIYTALPGMITCIAMTWLIEQGTWYDKKTFNIIFLCLLVPFAVRMLFNKKNDDNQNEVLPRGWVFSITGFFTGIVTSLSGLGGGIVMVPVFTDVLRVRIKTATSISTGTIPFFALPIGIYYMQATCLTPLDSWQQGYVVFPLVLPLILSVLVMAPLGVRTAHKVSPAVLRVTFALFALGVIATRIW